MSEPAMLDQDFGCCALDDAAGSGHDGPCGRKCSYCAATGTCQACYGESDFCHECDGNGNCTWCDEGWEYDER